MFQKLIGSFFNTIHFDSQARGGIGLVATAGYGRVEVAGAALSRAVLGDEGPEGGARGLVAEAAARGGAAAAALSLLLWWSRWRVAVHEDAVTI